jgi:hypothetical protein
VLREPLGLKAELPRMNAGAPTTQFGQLWLKIAQDLRPGYSQPSLRDLSWRGSSHAGAQALIDPRPV